MIAEEQAMAKKPVRATAKPDSVRTSVTIPAQMHAELEQEASRMGVSVAWVIRQAIGKYLDAERPLFAGRDQ